MSKLYLVPTPIGNLEDITLRAIRILKECDIIFAEDTRVTKRLLQHLEIQKPLQPFHAHNEHKSLKPAVDRIASVENAVLVSDAGTPGISDPGFLLIRECIREGIPVECLPGPSAFVPAVVASGFPCDKFMYEGFLPHKKGRQTLLKNIAQRDITTVVYESPHRLQKCLAQIEEFMGPDREVCVARELTKMYEEFQRGPVSEVKAHYEANPPKGEIVVVISGVK
ncbi:MAG: 16S rRNA (cytidine(1402)-2'-O)-methyltransferase [Fluviicola sp. XM-24bin1]|nr:MAG: 16S rRNA (cytidine(1402)-2'-O)-methyltransferase [Fluviicola sp. XM-24bin1]